MSTTTPYVAGKGLSTCFAERWHLKPRTCSLMMKAAGQLLCTCHTNTGNPPYIMPMLQSAASNKSMVDVPLHLCLPAC